MKKTYLIFLLFSNVLSFAQNNKQKDENVDGGIISFFSFNFQAILFSILSLILIYTIFKIFQALNYHDKEIRKLSNKINTIPKITPPSNSLSNKIEEQLNILNNRIAKLETIDNSIKTPHFVEEVREVIFEIPKKEPETTVFYMATPDKDGYFNLSSQHNSFRQGATYYKFDVDENNANRAHFEFYSDDYGVKASANYPQTYIEPVCEPQNAQNPNAKSIITVKKGIAEREGDKWIVKQKAKIEYR